MESSNFSGLILIKMRRTTDEIKINTGTAVTTTSADGIKIGILKTFTNENADGKNRKMAANITIDGTMIDNLTLFNGRDALNKAIQYTNPVTKTLIVALWT